MEVVYPTVSTGFHVSATKGLTLDKISVDLADRDTHLLIEELHFQLTQYDAYRGYNPLPPMDCTTCHLESRRSALADAPWST